MTEPVRLSWGALAYPLPIPLSSVSETLRDARRRLGSTLHDTVVSAHGAIPEARTHLVVARDSDLRRHLASLVPRPSSVAEDIRAERARRALSQEQVGEIIEASATTVARAETESCKASAPVIASLLRALDIAPNSHLARLLAETDPADAVGLLELARRRRGRR